MHAQVDGHKVGCSCDVPKLWRGLGEERLDNNLTGQNGPLSLEWVPPKMISNLLVVFHLQLTC